MSKDMEIFNNLPDFSSIPQYTPLVPSGIVGQMTTDDTQWFNKHILTVGSIVAPDLSNVPGTIATLSGVEAEMLGLKFAGEAALAGELRWSTTSLYVAFKIPPMTKTATKGAVKSGYIWYDGLTADSVLDVQHYWVPRPSGVFTETKEIKRDEIDATLRVTVPGNLPPVGESSLSMNDIIPSTLKFSLPATGLYISGNTLQFTPLPNGMKLLAVSPTGTFASYNTDSGILPLTCEGWVRIMQQLEAVRASLNSEYIQFEMRLSTGSLLYCGYSRNTGVFVNSSAHRLIHPGVGDFTLQNFKVLSEPTLLSNQNNVTMSSWYAPVKKIITHSTTGDILEKMEFTKQMNNGLMIGGGLLSGLGQGAMMAGYINQLNENQMALQAQRYELAFKMQDKLAENNFNRRIASAGMNSASARFGLGFKTAGAEVPPPSNIDDQSFRGLSADVLGNVDNWSFTTDDFDAHSVQSLDRDLRTPFGAMARGRTFTSPTDEPAFKLRKTPRLSDLPSAVLDSVESPDVTTITTQADVHNAPDNHATVHNAVDNHAAVHNAADSLGPPAIGGEQEVLPSPAGSSAPSVAAPSELNALTLRDEVAHGNTPEMIALTSLSGFSKA